LLKDRLLGTWGLISLETRHSDGTTTHRFGPSPTGRFMFDADGNFSVQLMNPNRRDDDPDGYVASWGEYEVDEEQLTFTLNLIGSVQPATIGLRTVRHINFKDGRDRVAVFNTDPQVIEGREEQTFITWEKISPGPTA
jgi:hypothetical protein